MLYSVEEDSDISYIPHRADFDRWKSGLSEEQYDAILESITNLINGSEVHTSSWMPGGDWSDTVYEPIYSSACNYDHNASGLFFGLLVWVAFMNHPDRWGFGRYEKDGIPIQGLTYFRVDR